jgi:DUF1707 SHOCT-like domain
MIEMTRTVQTIGPGSMRVGHTQRGEAIERLTGAYTDGRRTRPELDHWLERVLVSRTRSDLDAVVADPGSVAPWPAKTSSTARLAYRLRPPSGRSFGASHVSTASPSSGSGDR